LGEDEATEVRNRLRELRAVHDWTQVDLADHLDVSRQTIYAIETGRYDPSLPLAFKIAEVFDQPIESLFFPDHLTPEPSNRKQRNPNV
jgi:putative transcriptional regulator